MQGRFSRACLFFSLFLCFDFVVRSSVALHWEVSRKHAGRFKPAYFAFHVSILKALQVQHLQRDVHDGRAPRSGPTSGREHGRDMDGAMESHSSLLLVLFPVKATNSNMRLVRDVVNGECDVAKAELPLDVA